MNPYKDKEPSSFDAVPHLAYEDIATKLLKDNYFLTALELHTELVESGKELPQLREFFSNPGNFEQHVSRASDLGAMHRTPSQATLDSLDTARYSEDGGGDRGGSGGDVAVLEFELRKARETINTLRANLTQFADSESTLDKNSKDKFDQRSLKPHEKKALNFLINEYLLLQDYKLTSITFSDENPDQEFEDWDDVGLNMPRPADLISLFWGNNASMNIPKVDIAIQTDVIYSDTDCQTDFEEGNVCVSCQTSVDNETDWNHEILIQAEEINLLKQKVIALETEKLNFQKLYDAAIVSLNSLTSPTSENKALDIHMAEDSRGSIEARPITFTATENHYGSGNSTHSATPEQFEMIDNEKSGSGIHKKEGSNTSSYDPANIGDASVRNSPLRRSSVTTLDETLSINDTSEWTRVPYEYNSIETSSKEMWIDSGLPISLKESILKWCNEGLNTNEPIANDLLAELVNSDKPITLPDYLNLVIDTMPRILPHTLVARRISATALLAAGAALSVGSRRARALLTLLTLLKRPTGEDTRDIAMAVCVIVKWGGSGEVLSSIAELLTSKSPERRLLASQICVSIAAYVPIELCTSLLLSLVILMCESSEADIRNLGLKCACLICSVAEHKYGQLEGLMFGFLKDPVESNVSETVHRFVPVLARSALISGKFSTELCTRIMSNLVKYSTENDWQNMSLYLQIIRELVIATLAFVINVQIVRDVTINSNCDIETVNLHEVPLEGEQDCFIDLQCYVTDSIDAKTLIVAANSLLKENPDVRWPELTWFVHIVKQILEVTVNSKVLSHPHIYDLLISLFNSYVEHFGVHFTKNVLKPIFSDIIMDLEHKMEKLLSINVDSTAIVGIYLVTILPVITDKTLHAEFLQKWVVYSSIRSLPVKTLAVPLKWVARHRPDALDFYLQHIREYASTNLAGPAHRSYTAALVTELAAASLPAHTLAEHLLPLIQPLLDDDDGAVREASITAWGALSRDVITRGLSCEAQCWRPLEEALCGPRPLSNKEAVRAAEALSLLVLPTPDSLAVSEKAVSTLCLLCHRAGADALPALAAGAQLAAHHCPTHPALLSALRKLEEIVQAPSLAQYRPAIDALIHNVTGVGASTNTGGSDPPRVNRDPPRTPNLQAAQEVGRRVTQMFQQSKTNMNLQNIFKKKT